MDKQEMDEDELRSKLTPEEYAVLREGRTEQPFSGEFVQKVADGTYTCKVCASPLFTTDTQEDANKNLTSDTCLMTQALQLGNTTVSTRCVLI